MNDKPTTRVLYSCRTCNLRRAGVDVPACGEEGVTDWMRATIQLLADDHQRRSPGCEPLDGKLYDIMIPTTGTDKVGGPVMQ